MIVRDLLMLLFTKERLWVIHSCGSLQKREWEWMLFKKRAMWVMLSWFKQFACKKWGICKKIVFFIDCWHFPPFLWIASIALRSFALLSEVTWAICSCHSLQKCVLEQFAQAAHAKREEEWFIERWKTVKNKWRKMLGG